MKKLLGIAATSLLVSSFGPAFGQSIETCDSVLAQYETYAGLGPSYASELASIRATHPACFSSSATGTSQAINTVLFSQARAISDSIGARLSERQAGGPLTSAGIKGLSAGGVQQPWNVWTNINQNDTDVRYRAINELLPGSPLQAIAGNSDIQNTVLGIDYALGQNMVVGVSVAFDDGDGWSRNITGGGGKISNSTDGYTIAPYIGYQLSKEFSVDASIGMGSANFSTSTAKADIDRWYAAANLSYNRWLDNIQFSGKLSYLHGDEDMSKLKLRTTGASIAQTDSSSAVDQLRIGAQIGVWMNGFMPFAGISYTSNVDRSGDAKDYNGRDSFIATVGLNFFSLSSKITGGIFYEEELNRSNSDNKVISGNINFRF